MSLRTRCVLSLLVLLSLATARAAVGEETFSALWAEGRAMTREQVIGYALEDAAPA